MMIGAVMEYKIFFITVITLVSEGAFETANSSSTSDSLKRISKRYEVDFPTCVGNFDIHTDTIIRAQDSRAIGGRYINETEVPTREECLKLCCQTSLCDVFIFEEKSPGSCYLFDCGSSDDFKCKFNPHHHYTSGVMAVNRHVAELESQIKLSKHEKELTGLRKTVVNPIVQHTTAVVPPVTSSTSAPSTLVGVGNAVASALVSPPINTTGTAGRRCSRYQFECRSSGECIAIYNACDGIPQCSDGSDEGPELACPSPAVLSTPAPRVSAPASPASPVAQFHPAIHMGQPEGPQVFNPQYRQPQQPVPVSWQPQGEGAVKEVTFPQLAPPPQQQAAQQEVPAHKFYTHDADYGVREGAAQWPAQQYRPPPAPAINNPPQNFRRPSTFGAEYEDPQNSHIFNHKGSGLISDSDGGVGYGEYGAGEGKPGAGYYGGVGPAYHQQLQQPAPAQQWPRPRVPQQDHDLMLGHSMEDELRLGAAGSAGEHHGHFAPPPLQAPAPQQAAVPDYYYEEGGPQQQRGTFHRHQHPPPSAPAEDAKQLKAHRPPALMEGQAEATDVPHPPAPAPETRIVEKSAQSSSHDAETTEHPLEVAHSKFHYSGEGSKKKALPPHLPSPLDLEQIPDGEAARPGGAYLSLSIGLGVTALLVVLISCRLRVVRRKLRRGGGKSPYAHDADFLVNGMYL